MELLDQLEAENPEDINLAPKVCDAWDSGWSRMGSNSMRMPSKCVIKAMSVLAWGETRRSIFHCRT